MGMNRVLYLTTALAYFVFGLIIFLNNPDYPYETRGLLRNMVVCEFLVRLC